MAVRTDRHDGFSAVYASGEIGPTTCDDLQRAVVGLMDDGETRIVLDLSATFYISSAGLRVLLMTAERLREDGKFILSAVSENVREVLEIAGFHNIIQICDTMESAAAAVAGKED